MQLRLESPDSALQTQPCFIGNNEETSHAPLTHYMWLLHDRRWKIVPFVLGCVLLTFVVTKRLAPVYEAVTTIEVERQPSGVVGQEAKEISLHDTDQFLSTQAKILQSDPVLRPVATRYSLLPKDKEAKNPGDQAPSEPVVLKELRVSRVPNTYLLQIVYRSKNSALAADVANAVAASYVDYTFDSRLKSFSRQASFMERQLDELRAKRERSNSALEKFERELNVMNPEEKTNILSARLLQLNTQYTDAQAERLRKESTWDSMSGNAAEAAETSPQGKALNELTDRLNQATVRFAQTKSHVGSNHPEYRRQLAEVQELQRQIDSARTSVGKRIEVEYQQASSREDKFRKTVAATKAELDKLNSRYFEYQALKQEADADRKLYEELFRRVKEAGINASFRNNAIRIVNPARPFHKPVFPNVPLNVALSFFGSLLFAIGAVFILDTVDRTVRDPVDLARFLNMDVIATLPVISAGKHFLSTTRNASADKSVAPVERLTNDYEESVRVLRSTIFLTESGRKPKSLLITSALAGEGKTTTALELCRANARQNRRTLLIDADLRRPSVHTRIDLPKTNGLAGYLCGEADWRQLVVTAPDESYLHILPAGRVSRMISDLAIEYMPRLLDETLREYDLVVVDSQPILGFSEPLQIAAAVEGVVVIARAGKTDRKAVMTAVATLSRVHANVVGVVLNHATTVMSDYNYGYPSSYAS